MKFLHAPIALSFTLSILIGTSVACSAADPESAAKDKKVPSAGKPAESKPVASKPAGKEPAWAPLTQPGEGQKALNDLAGSWNYTTKYFPAPGAKPHERLGKSTATWVMGGRFLEESVKGNPGSAAPGEPIYEGHGMTGFDNVRKEYQTAWIDNMSTQLTYLSGTMDAQKKVLTMTGTGSDPMTNQKRTPLRTVLKIQDKDHHTFEFHMQDTKGKMYLAMQIAYTRAK